MPSETIFRVPLWLFSFSLILLTLPACAQQAVPMAPAAGEITSYGDCSLIDFKDIDGSELTKAELLERMDADFAANLNQSEKCMAEAINSGAGRISAAGAGASGVAEAAAGTNEQAAQSASTEQTQNADSAKESDSSPSKATQKGKAQQGNSAVCETVKQGLAGATTEAEKKHFSALMTQYGCE
jgi:hypothetical protein